VFGDQIPVYVIDFEGAPSYGVVEYGVATLFHGEISDTKTRLCAALAPIDPSDVAVHGISYEESLLYESFEKDYELFSTLRARGPFAAHNARYESRLMKQTWSVPPIVPAFGKDGECALWGPWIDSCALARVLAPGLSRYRLETVVQELGLSNELNALALECCPENRRRYHTALYDAIAAGLILKKLLLDRPQPLGNERLFSVKG